MLYKGEYSPKTTYAKLDVVYQDSTKSSYISLQDNNIGKEPKDNPTFWGVISKAKYEVNDQDIKDAVTSIIATSDFKVGNMNIVTANPSIDFHFNNSEEPTSSIKEFSSGILQVPGSLVVLGDLLANANSARALDHPIQINGQDIQTVVNNNSMLTADVQVNTLKASTDLSDLSVYPSLNATYGLSGKYVASPNDATSYTAILQVSSYPDASHVRLTLIDTGTLGSIYTRTYTSGNWSTWQKIVIDSDTVAKASTAGKLAKAVSINGTAFDGSSDIAVNAANDSTLVHKSGNESIVGNKTFTGNNTHTGTEIFNGSLVVSNPTDITMPMHTTSVKLFDDTLYLTRYGNMVKAKFANSGSTYQFHQYATILPPGSIPVGYRPLDWAGIWLEQAEWFSGRHNGIIRIWEDGHLSTQNTYNSNTNDSSQIAIFGHYITKDPMPK